MTQQIFSDFGDRDIIAKALSVGAIYLFDFLRSAAVRGEGDPAWQNEDRLTVRETQLLQAFATGKSYKEAARVLHISPHTVGNHVKSIYRKLEVNSRSDAIREARRGGEI